MTPNHPMMVHLPLGLVPALPLLAAGLGWAIWKDRLSQRTWLIVVALQALVFAGCLAAERTGEQEEERLEAVGFTDDVHEHEEAAEAFVVGAGVTLALALAGLLLPQRKLKLAAMAATVVATLVTLGLGVRTGQAGGHIVHGHMIRPELALPDGAQGATAGKPSDDD